MKQRKIAISLAVVGAIAAPFVFDTYESVPSEWKPLTAEQRNDSSVWVLENCQNFAVSREEDYQKWVDRVVRCALERSALEKAGSHQTSYRPSIPEYLLRNAVVVIASFVVILGLTYLLLAIARLLSPIGRRYWRWLNT